MKTKILVGSCLMILLILMLCAAFLMVPLLLEH